jgi:hypothetical protein
VFFANRNKEETKQIIDLLANIRSALYRQNELLELIYNTQLQQSKEHDKNKSKHPHSAPDK